MSTDNRLSRLDDLERRWQDQRKRALWIAAAALVGGAVVVGLLFWGAASQLGRAYTELAAVQKQKAEEDAKLLRTRAELQQAEGDLQRVRAAITTSSPEVQKEIREAETSVQSAQPAPPSPSATPLRARAYLHISDPGDRGRVETLATALRDANFIVPGIEYVPRAKMKATLVKYFKRNEEPEARRLLTTLQGAGLPLTDSALSYTPGFEDSRAIRPNHLEVWFAPLQ